MGAICLERLLPADLGSLAIETGTCRGHGARSLARHFPRVITIELSEELFLRSREALRDSPNVECVRGSSAQVLANVLPSLPSSLGTFFFLDAHWSGDRTVNWAASKWKGYGHDTAHLGAAGAVPSSREQCPLVEELVLITSLHRGPACVLIDDIRNVGKRDSGFPGEDWTHVSKESLVDIVKPRLLELRELERPHQWFLRLSAL